jgi:hypothetical protein
MIYDNYTWTLPVDPHFVSCVDVSLRPFREINVQPSSQEARHNDEVLQAAGQKQKKSFWFVCLLLYISKTVSCFDRPLPAEQMVLASCAPDKRGSAAPLLPNKRPFPAEQTAASCCRTNGPFVSCATDKRDSLYSSKTVRLFRQGCRTNGPLSHVRLTKEALRLMPLPLGRSCKARQVKLPIR